ncbi:hypothetical protein HIM_10370 [Hirsutella minnesotensis 3608]|uniref:Uncharacterized protein n=1 Tax=Hirsutella minnesotensis 3608 TaxID=1043627 RepID=A0A0F7ZX73_9HYPO|nr:hypothetical protein HIM_10370 [Hirsutella minnesotensis 3608]
MVRFAVTVLALSVSALAVTSHNERRDVELSSGSGFVARAAPPMVLEAREKRPDSPEVAKLKEERKGISPELDAAHEELKKAHEAEENAIPQDLKAKTKEAKQKVKDTYNALPEDKKAQLKDMGKKIRDTKKGERGAATSGAPGAAPATSAASVAAPAATPAATPAPARF